MNRHELTAIMAGNFLNLGILLALLHLNPYGLALGVVFVFASWGSAYVLAHLQYHEITGAGWLEALFSVLCVVCTLAALVLLLLGIT